MNSHKKGFSLVEVILAAFIFTVFASGAIIAVISGHQANRLGEEETLANQYASEGIEAVRSIKNQNFTNLVNSAGTGLARVSGVWTFSGSNNQFGPNNKYSRVISVADVQRDVNGNIVTSGGTVDSLTKKIVSTVSWSASAARANSVVLTTYLTNWRKAIIGNWANPTQQSSLDLAVNGNGAKVAVLGNYAYVVRTVGSPNFYVINIANPAVPTIASSLNFGNTPTNIVVSGNYAYVSSRDNVGELQIVDISNPTAPSVVGTFDAAGNADANALALSGNYIYLVRDTSQSPNFYIINVSNPAAPSFVSSLSLAGNLQAVTILGGYAHIASANNGSELISVLITNPATPSQVGSLNLAGNSNALSIAGFSNTVFMGRVGGEVAAINVSTPSTPVNISTINVGGDVNDIALDSNNIYLFLATANSTAEFSVVDMSNLSAMNLLGSLNMANTQNGIAYSGTFDRVYIVGSTNNAEFAILQPN